MKENHYRYVLITPAQNEEFVELTLKPMVQQTLRPARWVIVSDGYPDRTDGIVRQYAAEYKCSELLRMPVGTGENVCRHCRAQPTASSGTKACGCGSLFAGQIRLKIAD